MRAESIEKAAYCLEQAAECERKAQSDTVSQPSRRAWMIAANGWYQEAARVQNAMRKNQSPPLAPSHQPEALDAAVAWLSRHSD